MRASVLMSLWFAAVCGCSDDAPASKGPRQPPNSPLVDREVRAFIKVGDGLEELRIALLPSLRPGSPNLKQAQQAVQQKINAYLAQHHYTTQSWAKLNRRITYVVEAMRWDKERPERNRRIHGKILKQKQIADGATDDRLREETAIRIKQLEATLDKPAPPTHAADRKLAKSYWADLDRLVPK